MGLQEVETRRLPLCLYSFFRLLQMFNIKLNFLPLKNTEARKNDSVYYNVFGLNCFLLLCSCIRWLIVEIWDVFQYGTSYNRFLKCMTCWVFLEHSVHGNTLNWSKQWNFTLSLLCEGKLLFISRIHICVGSIT